MKTTLLTLSIVSAATLSLAQASFGIRAGGNANYVGVPDADSKTRSELKSFAGFHAGAYVMLPLSERLFFSPELQYVRKGMDSQEGPRLIFHYLEVPLIFAWAPVDRISFDAGPGVAYNVASFLDEVKMRYAVEKIDFGINGGFTFSVTKGVSVVARYFHGMVPFKDHVFIDGNANVAPVQTRAFNRTVQLGMKVRVL